MQLLSTMPGGGGGVTDHGALTGLGDDDHTQYGHLSQAETWAALQTFSAGLRLAAAQSIEDSGGTARYTPATGTPRNTFVGELHIGSTVSGATILLGENTDQIIRASVGAVNSYMGAMIGAGASVIPAPNYVTGIGGRAATSNASAVGARGLDFAAQHGSSGTLTELVGCKATTINILRTVTNTYAFLAPSPTMIVSTDINVYQFYASAMLFGTNRHPFYDPGTTESGDSHGSVFKTSVQLFSTTIAFGSGVGVLGIANAVTNPSTNPVGGGVLYVTGGALRYRGSAGTDTLIAAA